MEILQPYKRILLNLAQPARVQAVIPHAELFPKNGSTLTVVPHRLDETIVLRNLSFDVPSPILYYYNWPGRVKPFDTQRKTAAMLTLNRRAFVLNELGTGKSLATLWALDYLMQEGIIRSALIVSPLSTLERVWGDEIFWNLPHRTFITLHGPKAKRQNLLKQHYDFYIINHDGVNVVLHELMQHKTIDAVVPDEVAVYRNRRTERWKALNRVIQGRKYVWGLTGTPMPNEPTDAYGQIMLINPARLNRSFRNFRDMLMTQISPFKWVARKDAVNTVHELMQPSVRFTRDECLDLPPIMMETLQAVLSAEQAAAYKKMVDDLRVQFKNGEIRASNEGVKLQKLLQIALGSVYDTTHATITMDSQPRLDVLHEILDIAPAKVIVFVPFIHALNTVLQHILQWGFSAALVHGGVSSHERDHIFSAFQKQGDPRVLVAHPQCMSHGLTLTQANIIVWYGPVWSNDTYEQANGRISRAGQTRKQLIINIVATPLESHIVKRLKNKQALQSVLLDLFQKGEQP